jgi:hypothetical protein
MHARADGAVMSTEFHDLKFGRLAKFGGFARPGERRLKPNLQPNLQASLLRLPVLPIVVLVGWPIWLAFACSIAKAEPAEPTTTAIEVPAPPPGAFSRTTLEQQPAVPASTSPLAAEVTPVNGLSISSQAWRRAGLGSKALVTFTLRNNNDYAVKDIELVCAFARADGSHLTDRRRVIADTVAMKSRKTFAHVLVGFVDVNASRAKCAPVAARRS